MFYIAIGLAALFGFYGLYRFFLAASVKQIKAFALTVVFIILTAALLFLAVTGRLGAAIGLVIALLPIIAGLRYRSVRRSAPGTGPQAPPPAATVMTRAEALEVLGLAEGATPDDIKAAYKTLIKKTHPDAEGSEWLAAKINQARDTLLRQ